MGNTRSKIALFFFGVILPGIFGSALPDLVAAQPWLALAVLVAYEALVLMLTPVGGAMGIWQKRAVTWIDHHVQGLLPGFRRRYREYLLRSSQHVDQSGQRRMPFFSPALDDVFIDVDLGESRPNEVPTGVLSSATSRRRMKLGTFLRRSEAVKLVVLGAPGSGKTTLLRHAARATCQARYNQRDVPILLSLRDHVRAITKTPETGLADMLRESLRGAGLLDPPGWFERRLDKGACVVLLDGLDEVPGYEERRRVSTWVEQQIDRYPNNHFVITSRAHQYWETAIPSATVTQTQRLTPEQADQFIRDWYLAIELGTSESSGTGAHATAHKRANDLWERLSALPELLKLTVNPLLLTMIANVYHERQELPDNRAELYRDVCEGVLWRQWRRKPQTNLSREQREVVLRELALTMMRNATHDLERGDLLAAVEPRLTRVSQRVSPEEFVTDIVVAGLIVEREDERYSFAHHTFQEYLAAMGMKESGLPEGAELRELVSDDWWRETLFLYAARGDATPVVRACLEVGTVQALALALDCVDQARELAPDLRSRMERMLERAFHDDTVPARRRLARALAFRYLREDIELPKSGGRLCARPVPVGLYRLFLARRDNAAEHTPDTAAFTEETSDGDTVVGTRSADATAFVRWINEILGDQPPFDGGNPFGQAGTFRLPTRQELSEYAKLRGRPHLESAYWTHSETGPKLWTPKGFLDRSINDTTLAGQVTEDVRRSTPLVLRLLLIRIARFLDALGCALSPDCDLGPDRIDSLFRALGRDSAQRLGVDLARLLVSDLGRDLDLARSLAAGVDGSDTLAGALERAHHLSRELDGLRAGSGAEPPTRRTHERVHQSSRELATAVAEVGERDSSRILAPDLTPEGPPFGAVMGRACSDALTTTLTADWQWSDASQFVEQLAVHLVARMRLGSGLYHISPETLADDVAAACAALPEELAAKRSRSVPRTWVRGAANRLAERAVPVFHRTEELTPAATTTIRMLALSLAAEADGCGAPWIRNDLRNAAAGVTLLRLRLDGKAPATETIMLAVA
ncbi:NACHT domain-containing protein [Halostreptopolyspora alba]|uniref:NACHT domain-containing protein n=1 Tax=Halostreptopolyspora alba TaxID=2487137 RepID=A0A3N0EHW8_9ACTN|nr:NACHT domain-containing protein [Nocardiopsaceae bacterium YIM 96095]